MAAQALEAIPEETVAPAVAPANKLNQQWLKTLAVLLLEKGWQNATVWPVKQRKRQKQRPQNKPQ